MNRRGYTIIEFVVCLVAFVLFVALLVPAVLRARQRARAAQCQANLRQFGVGLTKHADQDPQTRFCTGAYDWKRDGCPDTIGWVADLVNAGFCRPVDVLCPSSPMGGLETLEELFSTTPAQGDGISQTDFASGICGKPLAAKSGDVFGVEGSTARRAAIEKHILDKGYSTNYTAHWFLVRGGPHIRITDYQYKHGKVDSFNIRVANAASWNVRKNGSVDICTGPLMRRECDRSRIPSTMIPLLGDGNAADGDGAVASTRLDYGNRSLIWAGDRLAASFSNGPATWDYQNHRVALMSGNVVIGRATDLISSAPHWSGQIYEEATGFAYGSSCLQDTRQFACHHAGSCNFLMADGSVRDFADHNGDGLLNPGFPADNAESVAAMAGTSVSASAVGYANATEDLPRTEVFGGLVIKHFGPTCILVRY